MTFLGKYSCCSRYIVCSRNRCVYCLVADSMRSAGRLNAVCRCFYLQYSLQSKIHICFKKRLFNGKPIQRIKSWEIGPKNRSLVCYGFGRCQVLSCPHAFNRNWIIEQLIAVFSRCVKWIQNYHSGFLLLFSAYIYKMEEKSSTQRGLFSYV